MTIQRGLALPEASKSAQLALCQSASHHILTPQALSTLKIESFRRKYGTKIKDATATMLRPVSMHSCHEPPPPKPPQSQEKSHSNIKMPHSLLHSAQHKICSRIMKPEGKSALLLIIVTYSNCGQHPTAPRMLTWPTTACKHEKTPSSTSRSHKGTMREEGEGFKNGEAYMSAHAHINQGLFYYLIGKVWCYCLRTAMFWQTDRRSVSKKAWHITRGRIDPNIDSIDTNAGTGLILVR